MKTLVRIKIETPTGPGNRKGWTKHVTGIDRSAKNGYAFEGEFLKNGTQEIPPGSLILETTPTGSVKNPSMSASIYQVYPDGITEGKRFGYTNLKSVSDWRSDWLEIRDAVEAALKEPGPEASAPIAADAAPDPVQEILDAMDDLLTQTVDADLAHGIELTEGESNGAAEMPGPLCRLRTPAPIRRTGLNTNPDNQT